MKSIEQEAAVESNKMPPGVVQDKLPFVPRMVTTPELTAVTQQVMDQWKHRDAFKGLAKYGIRPLDRLLFYGPPGNGKTMACYWIAREMKMPIYRVLCNQLHGPYLGMTTSAVADVLSWLNRLPEPALCLWDEVEAIFMDRKQARSGADREVSTATTMMLQALDRWTAPVLIVMATNIPEKLDEALLSRIEMRLEFPGPTPTQCRQMIQYWSELLHAHGSEDWAPKIASMCEEKQPESFRALQQTINFAARNWVAAHLPGGK
jgi:ATP-dependent 26S proteasome regulatory subunit